MLVSIIALSAVIASSIATFADARSPQYRNPPSTSSNLLRNRWTRAEDAAASSGAVAANATRTLPANAETFNPFEGLSLTPSQHTQMRALTARTRAARTLILARQHSTKAPSDSDRAELLRLAEAHNVGVRAILSTAQRQRLDANLKLLRARHAETIRVRLAARRAQVTRRAP